MKKNYTIEEGFLRLEEIETLLADPKISLEQAMKFFEEGSGILAQCNEKLSKAKLKVEQLSQNFVLDEQEEDHAESK